MAPLLGKRYMCAHCGAEVLCTKSGEGKLECCGKEMVMKDAAQLPSSD